MRRRPVLPSPVAFWSLAGILGLFLAAASAPSPLYQVYAARWHFSSITLTIVFAIYAIALLAALLVTGRLSDHIGRRPVILSSIVGEIIAMLCCSPRRTAQPSSPWPGSCKASPPVARRAP